MACGSRTGRCISFDTESKKWMDEADVIIYDALISAEILSLIPDGKEWIYVGKRSGHHCVRQEEINQILLREAKAGKNVLRLKGKEDRCIRERGRRRWSVWRQKGFRLKSSPE